MCAFWDQDRFGHPDNYVPANPMVTPALIAPEWYFLPFYGVIRAIPHKALGIAIMAVLIVCLFGAVRGFGAAVGSASRSSVVLASSTGVGRGSVSDGLGDSGAVAGNFSAFALSLGAANRTSAWLWVLDMWCLSVICLEVNHAESL